MRGRRVIALVLTLLATSASAVGCDSGGKPQDNDGTTARQAQPLSPVLNGRVVERGGQVGSDGSGVKSVPLVPAQLVDAPLPTKEPLPVVEPTQTQRPRELLLAEATKAQPDDLISATLTLKDLPADWEAFAQLPDKTARAAFVDQRRASLDGTRLGLINWLASVGAKDIGATWLANHVHARIPAKHLPAAVKRPEVVEASGALKLTPGGYGGRETQNATRIANLYNANINGHGGSRVGGGRIKIGIIEWDDGNDNFPVRGHVGWNARDHGANRMVAVKTCYSFGCFDTSYSAPGLTHGHIVSWVAGASIEAGQDTAFPGNYTDDQRVRSGNLRDAYLRYYQVRDNAGLDAAIDAAVAEGVDVINMSFGFTSNPLCDRYRDGSGVNASLAAAVAAGVVPVACAGNDGPTTGCSAWWPGTRTETLAVGGLNTLNQTDAYASVPMLANASRGGMTVRLYSSGAYVTQNVVDLVAPGVVQFVGAAAPNAYDGGNQAGCSIASPIVSAFVGGLKNAFHAVGFPQNAKLLMTQALLMGDGWNTTQITAQGTSDLSGAGRVRAHWPSAVDMTGPWGWGWREVTILDGQTVEWPVGDNGPESSLITQWKWAVLWTEPDLDNVSDIDFRVVNKCPPGGGEQTLLYDAGYQVRARFRLGQSSISGRCLFMRAYGYKVVPGGKTFYSADYFHSGDPSTH